MSTGYTYQVSAMLAPSANYDGCTRSALRTSDEFVQNCQAHQTGRHGTHQPDPMAPTPADARMEARTNPRLPATGKPTVVTPTIAELAVPRNPLFDRPTHAPNGAPWPTASGYVAGYPRLAVGGDAEVVVDNTRGQNDLLVKLVRRDAPQPTAVRVVVVRAGKTFPLKRVGPARYDMRYLNLDTGSIYRTDEFEVTAKKRSDGGVEYMGWTVPLYRVFDGTEQHDEITAAEF